MTSTTRILQVLAVLLCAAVALPAYGVTLYDNGPLITHPGGMTGAVAGADRSAIGPTGTIFGYGAAQSTMFRVADNFTVGNDWDTIEEICFFTYQTAATVSTVNAINFRIWDGVPGAMGSSVVFGDTVTNRLTSTGLTNIYRTTSTSTTDTARRIQLVNAGGLNLSLAPGSYWLDWQIGGLLASGPWQPPVSSPTMLVPGNGVQFDPTAMTWNPLLDGPVGAQIGQDLPFLIKGTIIPEPSGLSLLALGAVGMLRRRRS